MRKLLTVLVIALLVVAMTVPAGAAENAKSWGKVPVAGDPIKIDGEMDPIYALGLQIKMGLPFNADATTGANGVGYVLWNGTDTLYVYCTVVDKEVLKTTASANAWDKDSVEVFIDYSNKNARTRDQYRVDVANVGTYYATSTITEKLEDYGFTAWGSKITDDGYAVEFEIKAYKEKISAGMNIGFDLQINDMYKKNGAETRAVYNAFSSQESKGSADKYDFLTLDANVVKVPVETTAAAKAADKAPAAAAQTADMSVLCAIVSMAAVSGAALSLKKRK